MPQPLNPTSRPADRIVSVSSTPPASPPPRRHRPRRHRGTRVKPATLVHLEGAPSRWSEGPVARPIFPAQGHRPSPATLPGYPLTRERPGSVPLRGDGAGGQPVPQFQCCPVVAAVHGERAFPHPGAGREPDPGVQLSGAVTSEAQAPRAHAEWVGGAQGGGVAARAWSRLMMTTRCGGVTSR